MPLPRSTLTVNVVIALAALAPAAAAANTACPTTRYDAPPVIFSDLVATSTLPTVVASANVGDAEKAALAEGHQALVDFIGGASPTYAFLLEPGGGDAAYASMEASFETMTGSASVGSDTFRDARGQAQSATSGAFYMGRGGEACACEQKKITAAGLYYVLGPGDEPNGVGERAVHELGHAVQFMKGDYPPTWLIEGGAVHLECLLNEKLSWGTMSYSDSFLYGGGRGGVVPNFLKFYASPYGVEHGLGKSGENACLTDNGEYGDLCGSADSETVITAGAEAGNAQYMWYDVGAVAIAWAINKSGKTSAQFWQAKGSDGFWNAISPWDGYDYVAHLPKDCPEDAGWKGAFLNFTGTYTTMTAFYAAFDAWAVTATQADVLAILESDADIRAMTATAFDASQGVDGTAHDPCAGFDDDASACSASSDDDASASSDDDASASSDDDASASSASSDAAMKGFVWLGSALVAVAAVATA